LLAAGLNLYLRVGKRFSLVLTEVHNYEMVMIEYKISERVSPVNIMIWDASL
jgi:phenylacetate-coenzyme A ligase PaaK-like adenylate-forming protein